MREKEKAPERANTAGTLGTNLDRIPESRRQSVAGEAPLENGPEQCRVADAAWALYERGRRNPDDHPILTEKGFRPGSLRELTAREVEEIAGDPPTDEGGHPLIGRLLIALVVESSPDSKTLASNALFIDESGRHSWFNGDRKSGHFWPTSRLPEGNGEGRKILVAEGVVAALSARESSGEFAVAALSASNQHAVADVLRARYPKAVVVVIADRGEERSAAAEVAMAGGHLVDAPRSGSEQFEGSNEVDECRQRRASDVLRLQTSGAATSEPPTQAQLRSSGVGASRGSERVELLRADQVTIESVRWLWKHWLARGKLNILAGEPSTGKTTVALALAATVTIGGRWPDGTCCDPGDILIWSGEDGASDTLAPRLQAMGADLKRVHFISSVVTGELRRSFDPAKDAEKLRSAIQSIAEPRLLIVDSIVSAVSGDSHKNAEVRRALAPLVDLADDAGLAVLGITHFTKGSGGRNPVERVTGSLAFGALARVVLIAAKQQGQQKDVRLLARAKSNLGPEAGGFSYEIEHLDIEGGVATSRLIWGAAIQGTARELLAEAEAPAESQGAVEQAAEWLKEVLAEGPVDSNEIKRMCGLNGHSFAAVKRAKKEIGARSKKTGMGSGWSWCLPNERNVTEGVQPENLSTFVADEHLRDEYAEEAEEF